MERGGGRGAAEMDLGGEWCAAGMALAALIHQTNVNKQIGYSTCSREIKRVPNLSVNNRSIVHRPRCISMSGAFACACILFVLQMQNSFSWIHKAGLGTSSARLLCLERTSQATTVKC